MMKRMRLFAVLVLVMMTALLAACGGSDDAPTAQPGTGGSGNLGSSGNTGDTDDGPALVDPTDGDTDDSGLEGTGQIDDMTLANDDPLVTGAIADLAARLGILESDITVNRAERVTWPDSSVGCAQPDMSYTQAQTEGSFIQLSASGETYNYHSGGSIMPTICESDNEMLPEDVSGTSMNSETD